MRFLEQRAHALMVAKATSKVIGKSKQGKVTITHLGATESNCPLCKGGHLLAKCQNFLQLSIEDRRLAIQKHKLCFNCLHPGHQVSQCMSGRCQKCNGHHHTRIHEERAKVSKEETSSTVTQINPSSSHVGQQNAPTLVILATALVKIRAKDGTFHLCRALLDSGSQVSFLSQSCQQRLGLSSLKTSLMVHSIGDQKGIKILGSSQLVIRSTENHEHEYTLEAFILCKITGCQPGTQLKSNQWTHINGLKLADPHFTKPGRIDILLGADIYPDLMMGGMCKGPKGTPTALQTTLGWIVLGGACISSNVSKIDCHNIHRELDMTVQRFWELPEDTPTKLLTSEEESCENHFKTTYMRQENGRFELQLPFRSEKIQLGDSRTMAIQRWKQMERRLSKFPNQLKQYVAFMDEYQALGHMELIPKEEVDIQSRTNYYLPHHAVLRPESTTTKLRVVFDASAKSSNGVSLNDILMVGPTVQDNLVPLLLRFRTHNVAMTADIAKMYRQIRICYPHTDYLRIVWRRSVEQPVQDYRLLTITYGTSSAPYQATRCLNQLAEDGRSRWPLAASILNRDFYVDDLITSMKTEEEAIQMQRELMELLGSGGFELRKWSSNKECLVASVPSNCREISVPFKTHDQQVIKALGILWHPDSDCFSFVAPTANSMKPVTKRLVLSETARLFDPLGWISPFSIRGKLLVQSLWQVGADWDVPVDKQYGMSWEAYQHELEMLQDLKIQRWMGMHQAKTYQLHAFCDASERAYAGVVYLRTTSMQGQIQSKLMAARAKVAPVKNQSIPRLELCAALLLSRLTKFIQTSMEIKFEQIHAYSDSMIVLAWLNSDSNRWKTFVANRVSEIHSNLPTAQWHHVKSMENPADCASRGMAMESLIKCQLWWQGPEALRNSDFQPDLEGWEYLKDTTHLEEKKMSDSIGVNHCHYKMDDQFELQNRYSSLSRLLRISAWCQHFKTNSQLPQKEREVGPLTVAELNKVMKQWVKVAQNEEFQSETWRLKRGLPASKGSRLAMLNPFLDKDDLLRVGGRLAKSMLPESQRHQLLLPGKHVITRLLIRQEHNNTLHGGVLQVLNSIQRHFWIIGGRNIVRQEIHKCIICHRVSPRMSQQRMGDLPPPRIIPSKPFQNSGVDYGGPFLLKPMKRQGQNTFKAYVALFICFCTKAVHLELVSELTSSSFIAALQRFVSRRGWPETIYSDCGTNFVGADKTMKEFVKFKGSKELNDQVSKELSKQGIAWHFNPPASPHFGGLWEAGIKGVKYHLKRIVGNVILNFEEMMTVLTQVEACLNSRPISPMSTDPTDLEALTPGHFLIGGPLLAIPEPDFTSSGINRLSRWQHCQQLVQHFWKRWRNEYLNQLQQRPKWYNANTNRCVGELVLIRDELSPPLRWKLGRILEVHSGPDGLVWVVTLQTASGKLVRPIVKISPLPMKDIKY